MCFIYVPVENVLFESNKIYDWYGVSGKSTKGIGMIIQKPTESVDY